MPEVKQVNETAPAVTQWFKINMLEAFNAPYDLNDPVFGKLCGAAFEDEMFTKAPYIMTTPDSIKSSVTATAIGRKACITQHAWNNCKFVLGTNGVQQIEYDYEFTGDMDAHNINAFQVYSFWTNQNNRLSATSQILGPYQVGHSFLLDFALYPSTLKEIKEGTVLFQKGHITQWWTEFGGQMNACEQTDSGKSCDKTTDMAQSTFSQKIADGYITNNLKATFIHQVLNTDQAQTMKIAYMKVLGPIDFQTTCPVATPVSPPPP